MGKTIQLLLDPTRATLHRSQGPPKGGVTTLGVWQILAAGFAGRPRTRRLSQITGSLPSSLRQLHVIEVVCGRKQDRRCRFLTRRQGRRAVVTPWKDLVKLAAPIKTIARVRQLHAVELSLRFPRCGGDRWLQTRHVRRHRCFGKSARSRPCQVWRAQGGYGNQALVTPRSDGFGVRHVIACPGTALRIMELGATYRREGRHSLTVTDLTAQSPVLLHQLRRLTSPKRRRR